MGKLNAYVFFTLVWPFTSFTEVTNYDYSYNILSTWSEQRYEIVNGVVEVEGVKDKPTEETPSEDKASEGIFRHLRCFNVFFSSSKCVLFLNAYYVSSRLRKRCAWILAHCYENK